jgi:hypothetical protein
MTFSGRSAKPFVDDDNEIVTFSRYLLSDRPWKVSAKLRCFIRLHVLPWREDHQSPVARSSNLHMSATNTMTCFLAQGFRFPSRLYRPRSYPCKSFLSCSVVNVNFTLTHPVTCNTCPKSSRLLLMVITWSTSPGHRQGCLSISATHCVCANSISG